MRDTASCAIAKTGARLICNRSLAAGEGFGDVEIISADAFVGVEDIKFDEHAINQAVVVVPMLEPMMTLIACVRFMSPDETNPTTKTRIVTISFMATILPPLCQNPVRIMRTLMPSPLFVKT